MEINWLEVIFYLLLIDALAANVIAFSTTKRWWHKHFGIITCYFPLARGWTVYYLILVLFIGYLIFTVG